MPLLPYSLLPSSPTIIAVLSTIHTALANGGFGPAYGLRGVVGGFADATGTIVQHYQSLCGDRFLLDLDLKSEIVEKQGELMVPFDQWPHRLFSIFEWGCAIQICQDGTAGAVYRVEPSGDGYHIIQEAASLEQWLERWMRAEFYAQSSANKL